MFTIVFGFTVTLFLFFPTRLAIYRSNDFFPFFTRQNFLLLSQTGSEFKKTNQNFTKNVSMVLVQQRESC